MIEIIPLFVWKYDARKENYFYTRTSTLILIQFLMNVSDRMAARQVIF